MPTKECLSSLGCFQSGQVLRMLPQPVEAVLPEECVRAAQAILDPSSGLNDAARCAHTLSASWVMCMSSCNPWHSSPRRAPGQCLPVAYCMHG